MRFAERAYFTPTLAAALLAAWLVQRMPTTRWRLTCVLAGAWLLASAGLSCQRIWVWRDDRAIIEHGVVESPNSLRLQLCAGALADADGDVGRARAHFERAAAIDPASPQPWFELADLDLRAGDRDGAVQALAKADAGRPREVARHRAEIDAVAARIATAAPR
jgi:tetratricopeptide (TPR) repeat protein